MILKDEDYIPAELFGKIKDQYPEGLYMAFDMGELYMGRDGYNYRPIGVRTIKELKDAFLKLTDKELIIPIL